MEFYSYFDGVIEYLDERRLLRLSPEHIRPHPAGRGARSRAVLEVDRGRGTHWSEIQWLLDEHGYF